MLQDAHFEDLIAKHLSGNILPEEEQELLRWVEMRPKTSSFSRSWHKPGP